MKVLVVYGTTEGQTAKIANHIADALRRVGHEATVRQAAEIGAGETLAFDGVIVGGSLHEGHYQRAVLDFVERNPDALRSHPSAFFSVSRAAASGNPDEREDPLRIAREATARAGWSPGRVVSFAGALKYTQYSWLKRMLMKHIAAKEGGATDTSRDFEYTNWQDVDRFVTRFAEDLANARTSS